MSIGMILLVITAILTLFGISQRVLDSMHLSDRMALLLIAAIFVGGLIPDISITDNFSFNIGGAVIPLGICVYLFIKAGTSKERIRAIAAALITGIVLYVLGRVLPDEPEAMVLDPNYLFGIVGGLIAYILGRSRRSAFIAGILGVMLSQIINAIVMKLQGSLFSLNLGGGGFFDTIMLSGIIAVVFAEVVGEIIEKISEKSKREGWPDENKA